MSVKLVQRLSDMAELEQRKAMTAEERAKEGGLGLQVIRLAERDRHIARGGAFLEVARIVLKDMGIEA